MSEMPVSSIFPLGKLSGNITIIIYHVHKRCSFSVQDVFEA